MKKWIALLVSGALSLGLLSGCGKAAAPADSGSAPAAPAAEGQAVELHILGAYMRLDAMVEGWEKMISNFEAENPGVKITLDLQGDFNEVPQRLAQARMAGQPVDFVRTTGGIIRSTLAPAGAVMDISEVVKPLEDRFVEGTLDNYRVGGRLWGIPYGETTTSCVFYNKTMFDELGLAEPENLEQLVACADALRSEKGLQNPWIHKGAELGYWPMWFQETYSQTSGNQPVEKAEAWLSGEKNFADEETTKAMAYIREMFEKGVLTQDTMDTDDAGLQATFAQGKAAMVYGGTWEYAPLLEVVGDSFEIGVFPFPSMDGKMKPQQSGAADDGVAIASNCQREHWDLIVKFLDHMTQPESAQLSIGPIQPLIPVLKGVEPVDLPCAQELIGFMPNTLIFLDWLWPSEINNVVSNQIAGVAAGQITPEDAVAAIQKSYEKQVAEEDYSYNWYDHWDDAQWEAVTPPAA